MEKISKRVCLLLVFLCYICVAVDGEGVCYTSRATTHSKTLYRQRVGHKYYRSCPTWRNWWRTCSTTKYHQDAYTSHYMLYHRVFQCCHGYVLAPGSRCSPHCPVPCRNGGTCVRPSVCQCTDDWIGTHCTIRVTISPLPRFGNMLGGTAVYIKTEVPTRTNEQVSCKFGRSDGAARRVNQELVVCVSPPADKEGEVTLQLRIGRRQLLTSQFLYKSAENAHAASFTTNDASIILSSGKQLDIYWPPDSLVSDSIELDFKVDIELYVQTYNPYLNKFSLHRIEMLKMGISNDGEETVRLDDLTLGCAGVSFGVAFSICPILFKIAISERQNLPSSISVWSGVAFFNSSYSPQSTMDQCSLWNQSTSDALRLRRLPSCPPYESMARSDFFYQIEDMTSLVTRSREYHFMFMQYFHPTIGNCYRQSVPYLDRSGQQCCYDYTGILTRHLGGGSADRISPIKSYYGHIIQDLVPFIHCCKEIDSIICPDYFYQRPAGRDSGYVLLPPACAVGDPHMVTLDGLKYTFNGKGEFILIQMVNNAFTLQGRMEQVLDNRGNPAPGTVFTALVARQTSSNTIVQFEVKKSDNTIRVLHNQEEVSFQYATKREFDDVVFMHKGKNTVEAWFSGGANMKVTVSSQIIASVFVSLPASMKRKTSGLMGTFNGITSDDLLPRNGTHPLPPDDTIENIHHKFGMTWIITEESESFFVYKSGESWRTFYHPVYVPTFAPTFNNVTLEREAKKRCGSDQFCLFDIAATKRVEIGAATMEGLNTLEKIIEMSKPITCDPICKNGVCMENNTCHCDPGYVGDRCTEKALEECAVNNCKNNGTCMRRALVPTCTCLPEFTGIFCEKSVPPFKLNVLNGSPRVIGSNIYTEFSSNRPASIRCTMDGYTEDCNQGSMHYKNVSGGLHILKIIAVTKDKLIARVIRRIFIGPCAIHLIDDGISVSNGTATISFVGTTDVTSFRCRMDMKVTTCRSPVRYRSLAPGLHRIIIVPQGCKPKREGKISEKFHV